MRYSTLSKLKASISRSVKKLVHVCKAFCCCKLKKNLVLSIITTITLKCAESGVCLHAHSIVLATWGCGHSLKIIMYSHWVLIDIASICDVDQSGNIFHIPLWLGQYQHCGVAITTTVVVLKPCTSKETDTIIITMMFVTVWREGSYWRLFEWISEECIVWKYQCEFIYNNKNKIIVPTFSMFNAYTVQYCSTMHSTDVPTKGKEATSQSDSNSSNYGSNSCHHGHIICHA